MLNRLICEIMEGEAKNCLSENNLGGKLRRKNFCRNLSKNVEKCLTGARLGANFLIEIARFITQKTRAIYVLRANSREEDKP